MLLKVIKQCRDNLIKSKVRFCTFPVLKRKEASINSDYNFQEILNDDSTYEKLSDEYFRIDKAHHCLIIQPFVKWGPEKLKISPEEQLEEAVALIKTLPLWKVEDAVTVPLDTLHRKTLFKSGSMDNLTKIIHKSANITAIFVNTGNLKGIQMKTLETNFKLPIFDRYKIVMQILKIHATSKHAKLQVALAELYYLQRKMQKDVLFCTHNPEVLKLMFQKREQKLKDAIKEVRDQRLLLRSKRKKLNYPVVAVVGYTNSGKTSIIKALTGEKQLQPKDQLFATLDVTVHSGVLPSGLEVLYVDTVGFISDVPTNLIECFIATLEDAMLADVILHVEDLSSSSFEYKKNHVLSTLKDLAVKTGSKSLLGKIKTVGNKCDILKMENDTNGNLKVSAKDNIGIDSLKYEIEEAILEATSRMKITVKVPNGGEEIRWLYKNSTVVKEEPDEKDQQYVNANIIIDNSNLQKFKHHFINKC